MPAAAASYLGKTSTVDRGMRITGKGLQNSEKHWCPKVGAYGRVLTAGIQ